MFKKLLTEDIKVGSGAAAEEGDTAHLQYVGTFAKSGVQFDTNDPERSEKNKTPLAFQIAPTSTVVQGMVDGVRGMKVGGVRKIKVPYMLAYGASGSEGIPPYSDLIFEIKLLYLVKKGEENDVYVEDVRIGTGPVIGPKDKVVVNYVGKFVNGRLFDSTYLRKAPVTFQMGKTEVITGIERGMEGMKVGGKRILTLNPNAGYGGFGEGVIPANAVLIYELEVVSAKPSGA